MSGKRKFDDLDADIDDFTASEDPRADGDEDDDDSDDADGDKYEILASDDIEGQEEGLIRHDGNVEITPFNMEEELEEGHFDSSGMYHWNKESNIRDNWLDNLNLVKIQPNEQGDTSAQGDSDSDEEEIFNEIELYREMLDLVKPQETINKALRRLGANSCLSASERLRRKKAGIDVSKGSKEDQASVTRLTELANKILSRTGNMDIYQYTYEHMSEKVNNAKKKKDIFAEPENDMYADDFSEKESAPKNDESTSKEGKKTTDADNSKDELRWEYKTSQDSDVTEGPYSTQQMNEWMKSGHFKDQVWVRKFESGGDFYSTRRIDFELYL